MRIRRLYPFYADNPGGGTPTNPTPSTPAPAEATIPKARFDEEAQRRRTLEVEVGQLRKQLEDAGRVGEETDRLRKSEEGWKEKYKALEAQIARSGAARKAGIDDDEGAEIAHVLYQRAPQDKRGTFEEWLTNLKKEGAEVPKPLQPYLKKADASGGGQPTPQNPGATLPRPAVPGQAPGARPAWDPQEMAGVLERARQGDPAAIARLRAATGREPAKR